MRKYGQAAIDAVELYGRGSADSPQEAWASATEALFPGSSSGRAKSCPKGAFLGLCEEGLVIGIPPDNYTTSKKNKGYAIRAVKGLRKGVVCEDELWEYATEGRHVTPNEQLDVVVSLWNEGLIQT